MNLDNAVAEPCIQYPNPHYPDVIFIMKDGKVTGMKSRKTGKTL